MADIKSITYNDVAGRQKGEELTNYTANYNSVGQVTSTAVYFYASGSDIVRAVSAGAEALNVQVNTYRNNYIGATAATLANIKSITYNDITNRQKGEELTNYTANYNSLGQVTTTAVYFYGSDRAASAAAEALNTQVNTYRLSSGTDSSVATLDNIKSITYNNTTGRQKGEELTDYTQNYNTNKEVTTTAVYFYGTNRASAAAAEALNTQINTYRLGAGTGAAVDTMAISRASPITTWPAARRARSSPTTPQTTTPWVRSPPPPSTSMPQART